MIRSRHTQLLLITFSCLLAACDRGASTPDDASRGQQSVRVAAAADLKFALDEIIAAFRAAQPAITVTPTYGSSGNFYSQLSNRAPFDIYFSADVEYPRKLVEAGNALNDSLFEYAIGHLVIWTPKTSAVDVEKLGIESLLAESVRKIAIANPEHAPYGRAAEVALKKLGVYDRVKDRLVLGENIAQTAQFIESGSADVGIIALSLALAPPMREKGKYWPVPSDAHPTIHQGGVIMSWAADSAAAREFRAFVVGPDGRAILQRYGFILPGE